MTTQTATQTLPLKTEVLNVLAVLEDFSKLLTDETLALKSSDWSRPSAGVRAKCPGWTATCANV